MNSLERFDPIIRTILITLMVLMMMGVFVGVLIDVSLMYIQYSSLSRVVQNTAATLAGRVNLDIEIFDWDLVAIELIEFQGVHVDSVTVQTCKSLPQTWGQIDLAIESDLTLRQQRQVYDQLCNNPRNPVRVTAQVEAPLIFLSLFGYDTITVYASGLSNRT